MKTYRTRAEVEQEQKHDGQATIARLMIYGIIVGALMLLFSNYEAVAMFIWSLRTP